MSGHDRYERLAATALDFPLTEAETGELRTHLIGCASCARFASGVRTDAAAASRRPRERAPERIRSAVVRAALGDSTVTRSQLAFRAAGTAAVAVALLAGLVIYGQSVQGPAHPGFTSFSRLPAVPFSSGAVADVTTVGSGLLALVTVNGGSNGGAISNSGEIWSSSDGQTWVRVASGGQFSGTTLQRAATDGSVVVVLGQDSGPSPVWRSTDEHNWSRVSGQFATCCGPGNGIAFSAITRGPGGFTLVGTVFAPDPSGGSVVGAVSATSADGISWELARPTDRALANGGMGGVAVGPAGLVAIGVVRSAGIPVTQPAPTSLAAWGSQDGRTWSLTVLDGLSTTADIRDLAANASVYVAVGRDGHNAAAWVSSDGRSWQAAPESPSLDNASMNRVIWLGSAFMAIGQTTGGDGIAWVSVDGQAWTTLDTGSIFAGAPISAVGEVGSRLVLFGTDQRGEVVGAISAAR